MGPPPLKQLHVELNAVKLAKFSQLSSEALMESLKPGREGCLKTRPDGTILDGHHRLRVLRDRGIDVDALAREVIPRE
jgi:ParB-like chromosome segregation protein Spo0J